MKTFLRNLKTSRHILKIYFSVVFLYYNITQFTHNSLHTVSHNNRDIISSPEVLYFKCKKQFQYSKESTVLWSQSHYNKINLTISIWEKRSLDIELKKTTLYLTNAFWLLPYILSFFSLNSCRGGILWISFF